MYGIEIQEKAFELAKMSVSINHLDDQIQILHDDLKGISQKIRQVLF